MHGRSHGIHVLPQEDFLRDSPSLGEATLFLMAKGLHQFRRGALLLLAFFRALGRPIVFEEEVESARGMAIRVIVLKSGGHNEGL